MGKTMVTVRNATGIDVKIQEGNAGVFVTRSVVKNGGTYTLSLDTNATYREYVLIGMPDNTAVEPVFSSDDVAELKEILIKKEGSEYFWEGIRANVGTPPALQPAASEPAAPTAAASPGFSHYLKKFFGLGCIFLSQGVDICLEYAVDV